MTLRPLRPEDADRAVEVQYAAFTALDLSEGRTPHVLSDEDRARSVRRVRHLVGTDPASSWAAEVDGQVAGFSLAMRRGPLWFLSLLVVDPAAQGRDLGRQLLDAALVTAEGASPAYLCSSNDPRALRRYGRAGFALHPAWDAEGPLDRALVPAVDGVRDGDWERDAEHVEAIATELRGAGHGPDLARYQADALPLLVAEHGYASYRPGRVVTVAARDEDTATRLLWSALAESGPEASVEGMTGAQQWAVDVVLAARLGLRPGMGMALRDGRVPFAPYLPSGAYG